VRAGLDAVWLASAYIFAAFARLREAAAALSAQQSPQPVVQRQAGGTGLWAVVAAVIVGALLGRARPLRIVVIRSPRGAVREFLSVVRVGPRVIPSAGIVRHAAERLISPACRRRRCCGRQSGTAIASPGDGLRSITSTGAAHRPACHRRPRVIELRVAMAPRVIATSSPGIGVARAGRTERRTKSANVLLPDRREVNPRLGSRSGRATTNPSEGKPCPANMPKHVRVGAERRPREMACRKLFLGILLKILTLRRHERSLRRGRRR
jgi:hypothetical protein